MSPRDDLHVAFFRAAAGSGDSAEDGMCAVAADARGPLSVFNVRTQCGRKGGIVEEVLMTSSRGGVSTSSSRSQQWLNTQVT